jgi:hypothetical protein
MHAGALCLLLFSWGGFSGAAAGDTLRAAQVTGAVERPVAAPSDTVSAFRLGGGVSAAEAMKGLGGLQVKELLLKLDALKASARVNSEEDFAIAYYDRGEDVLYEGLEQNNKFFGEVLKDDDLMRRFLGLYVHDVYETLRGDKGDE